MSLPGQPSRDADNTLLSISGRLSRGSHRQRCAAALLLLQFPVLQCLQVLPNGLPAG